MLCSKCKKNMAVVFVKRMEGGKTFDEGYCMKCANELGIAPLNDMMSKMGITPDDLENMESQITEMMENGELDMDSPMGVMNMFSAPNDEPTSDGLPKAKKGKDGKPNKQSTLETFGTNLNKKAKNNQIDRIIGREKELSRVIQILNRRAKNNPALIGEPGVGKTAVAEALALKIVEGAVPSKLLDREVYLIDFAAMVAGTQFRGQFEARVKNLIEEVKKRGNVILVIDEIHNIVGSSSNNEGALSAANIMKPSLARGDIQVIGATTLSEYRKYIEKDAALERRFQPVIIEEPSREEAIEIIKGIKDYYEDHHKIILNDDIIKQAVILSERFIQGRFLPDKAIDVIDEAGSSANLENEVLTQLTILENKLKEVKKQREELDNAKDENTDYEKLAELKSKECKYEQEIAALKPQFKPTVITAEDISSVIEMWTNIPVKKLTNNESNKLMTLEADIKKEIIGQDEAVEKVAKAIRRKRAGIELRKKPASFIFVGPTGIGKTELVKVLAKELFGSRDDLIRLDMTEYQEQHSVSKLIGSPPGYVGYDDAGQLTEKVRRKPYSVVLFDEIEKAHDGVYNILLQILDEGRLTDSQGRTVNFENTVIILTSNAGIGFGNDMLGFTQSEKSDKENANKKLQKIFKPELLNRIDEIVVFNKLNKEDFKKISRLAVGEIQEALLEKGITLIVDDEALDFLAERGYSEKYGARELRRTVQKLLGDKVAEAVVSGLADFGSIINASAEDNDIILDIK